MTYLVSLKLTAIIVGLLYIAGHLPCALAPERATPILRRLPRNYPLGVVLMLAATAWFTILTAMMDLGEISSIRDKLMMVWVVGGGLLIVLVPAFLALRGLGCLLLLGAALVLDAAFLYDTAAADVIKIVAYAWVLKGMVLVYSPHRGRDMIQFISDTPQRLQLFSWPGVALGLVLIGLGIFAYPE
jgi:hypothetical protein